MKIIILIFLLFYLNISFKCIENKNVSLSIEEYKPRSFFFLPPIIPLNSLKRRKAASQKQPCLGDNSLYGICTSKSECGTLGGTSSGLCSDSLVCCISFKKCNSFASENISYFINPNYPEVYQGGSQCLLKITKTNPKICQIRLEFKEFTLMQPTDDGKCQNDFFSASHCLINKICGDNKEQHMYMDFPEGSDSITLSVDTNAALKGNRKWNIEVKQISCESSMLAPSGCLMYFTGTSGTVSSFNYGESKGEDITKNRQIRNLNYGICIHSKNEYCSIEWTKDNDPYSFTISGNSSLIQTKSITNESIFLTGTECKNSYIIIANPYQNGKSVNSERFCGSTFRSTISSMKPFVLYVVMGQNATLNTEDESNRGFKLHFRQLSCRN